MNELITQIPRKILPFNEYQMQYFDNTPDSVRKYLLCNEGCAGCVIHANLELARQLAKTYGHRELTTQLDENQIICFGLVPENSPVALIIRGSKSLQNESETEAANRVNSNCVDPEKLIKAGNEIAMKLV